MKVPSSLSSHSTEIKNFVIEEIKNPNGFPPPPSPTTLHRSTFNSTIIDPRLDSNFSSVIAKRAAESKARRHENPSGLEFHSNGLPASTTFFNNCVTTNGVQQYSTHHGNFFKDMK